jgi:phage recombination protein Bet
MDKSIAQSLTVVESGQLGHGFSSEQIEIIKNSVAKGVSNEELAYFLEVARSTGLNPLRRQIYAIMRSGKMTIQTGIDGYRLLAHRSRRHVGTDDAVYDTESATHPNKATVTVYKHVQGQRSAFTATARWKEYAQESNSMWQKFPYLMLAKCAESLALRKAFPAETSGIYTEDEMMQADTSLPARVVPPVTVQELSGGTVESGYKKSSQDRWNELHAFALELGFTEAIWRGAVNKYPTTERMKEALDVYAAQHSEFRDGPPDAEEIQATEEEMAAWDQLHARASDAGMSVETWDDLVGRSNGDITFVLNYVKTQEGLNQRSVSDLRKVPAGKGRH